MSTSSVSIPWCLPSLSMQARSFHPKSAPLEVFIQWPIYKNCLLPSILSRRWEPEHTIDILKIASPYIKRGILQYDVQLLPQISPIGIVDSVAYIQSVGVCCHRFLYMVNTPHSPKNDVVWHIAGGNLKCDFRGVSLWI